MPYSIDSVAAPASHGASVSPRLRASLLVRYGPWAVVTGASDGIGQAFARTLAECGFNLVLVARRGAALEALARQWQADHGVTCIALAADLSQHAGNRTLLAASESLDVGLLVAAAGFGTSGDFVSAELDDELNMLDLNCKSAAWLAHHYGQRLCKRRRGGMILLSSLLAFQGVPRAANYAATKAYIQTLAEGLRIELQPHGVDVVACAPGPIASGFAGRANMNMTLALPATAAVGATLAALGRQTTVRPGWLSKLLGWSLAPLPRWAKTRILAQVMREMTAHQRGPGAGD